MNTLIYTLGVVVFVIGVVISIALHEVGHMYPAKKFGIKVTQFFVGFGNTLWSTKRGETEYGFKSIPLGGYVKLVGMLPPAKDADPHEVRKTNTGLLTQLVSDARNAEYEHVNVNPALRQGDSLQLFMDGTPRGEPQQGANWDLTNVFRGRHDLTVGVIDGSGETIVVSDPVTVFVFRPSTNFTNRQPPAKPRPPRPTPK